MAIEHWRHLWIDTPRFARHTFSWRIIQKNSFVVITAAEARLSANPPERFIGDAKPIAVGNIAAQDGFVEFILSWGVGVYWNFPRLDIWTDITVFDPNDPSGIN